MKRIETIIIVLIILFFTAGCSQASSDETVSKYYAYYINKSETKVVAEAYDAESDTIEELVLEFLSVLETDPANTELKKPIDSKVNLLDYYLDEGQLVIDFDEKYNDAEKAKEVLCRAAIVRTMTQIEGVDCVSFRVNGEPLLDSNKQPIGVMTAANFIDNTGKEINTYEKTNLQLYFADEEGEGLVSTMETVAYSSNISMEKLVAENIIAGPKGEDAYPTISPDTKILGVTAKDGICYINLSKEFLVISYPVSEEVIVYSLVNSLTELPNINKVQISVEGDSEVNFGDRIALTTVFERNLELVSK